MIFAGKIQINLFISLVCFSSFSNIAFHLKKIVFLFFISFFCSGRFSSVKKCIRKDSSEQIFAAKIIKKRNVQHAINELRIFQLSHKHSNFVTFYQVFDLPTEAIFILE